MAFRIGFTAEHPAPQPAETSAPPQQAAAARRSVVQVHFAGRNTTLPYYNDLFDLHCGDTVYVEGKLEGQQGRVTGVDYNFRIRRSDYKRVIAVADTHIRGQLFMAGSHFVSFDPTVLPEQKLRLWFKAPVGEEEEFVSGRDDSAFRLEDLREMNVSAAVAERGHRYYMESRVRYLCLAGTRGYALVEGSEVYEVEFEYRTGEIGGLSCSCFCRNGCKHEFAAMLQLKETLELIESRYADEYARADYFAAVSKATLFTFAIDRKDSGSFTLQ